VPLSRELAKRGHQVLHAYCKSILTPRGSLTRFPSDADTLDFLGLDLGETIPKSGFVKRFRMESQYARIVEHACDQFQPDVILSGNTPSIPQLRVARWCQRNAARHLFWVQDIYGLAAYKILQRRLPWIGGLAGHYLMNLDKQTARLSDALVVITEDFVPIFERWGVPRDKIHVMPNWSSLDELPQRPRDNPWAATQRLGSGPRLLYSGTLAMKHNPSLLLELARRLDQRGDGQLIVISEGEAINQLRADSKTQQIQSMTCLGFQPFDQMADVLGSADLFLVLLEPDAGVISVPSKVLSYLCAGRPIVGAMPANNLAARIITQNDAGTVVAPDDVEGFCQAVFALLEDPQRLASASKSARDYAQQHFDIHRIADRFETMMALPQPIGS
jgi:glycosyltransferase involved in cell wall biosynthesis